MNIPGQSFLVCVYATVVLNPAFSPGCLLILCVNKTITCRRTIISPNANNRGKTQPSPIKNSSRAVSHRVPALEKRKNDSCLCCGWRLDEYTGDFNQNKSDSVKLAWLAVEKVPQKWATFFFSTSSCLQARILFKILWVAFHIAEPLSFRSCKFKLWNSGLILMFYLQFCH